YPGRTGRASHTSDARIAAGSPNRTAIQPFRSHKNGKTVKGEFSTNQRTGPSPATLDSKADLLRCGRDGKIISFGIAKNLSHARWRNISRELSVWERKVRRNYKGQRSDENRNYWSGEHRWHIGSSFVRAWAQSFCRQF